MSSRRRHTRLQGDWSSDVCSSDLTRTLERRPGQLIWSRLRAGEVVPLVGAAGPSGLTIEPVPVPGTVPLHLKGLAAPSPEDNLAFVLRDAHGRSALYAPTVAART